MNIGTRKKTSELMKMALERKENQDVWKRVREKKGRKIRFLLVCQLIDLIEKEAVCDQLND